MSDLTVLLLDSLDRFRVLTGRTTATGTVSLRCVGDAGRRVLQLDIERAASDPPEFDVCVVVPLRGVGGDPREFALEVHGDGSKALVWLEAIDGRGALLHYEFGRIHFSGWQWCRADVHGRGAIDLPIQPLHIGVTLPPETPHACIRFAELRVTGESHMVPVGLAGS